MTIQEAIKEAQARDQWFRPVTCAGKGFAFCITESGGVNFVPSPRGGTPAVAFRTHEVLGDWEVVSPDVVNTELP